MTQPEATKSKPDLFHHGTSVCAAKVRMGLEEKGVAWNSKYVDIRIGEQQRSDFLKLNPKGQVPVLVHRGNAIRESTIINEYVDEAFEGPPLKPADPVARSKMRLWTERLDQGLHHVSTAALTFAIALREVYEQRLGGADALRAYVASRPTASRRDFLAQVTELGIEAPLARESLFEWADVLDGMEADLATGAWLAGDACSLADIAYAPYMTRLECLQLDFLWEKRPRVAEWYGRLKSRPSYQTSVYAWLVQEEVDRMRENGRKYRPRLREMLRR